ncbi:hypothetical protein NU688_00420 [Variovorax sp. ZS18.2.2]|uniref:hypothetical protein n=1 Tax=Variovorax sp. ZS18.2.2 TaxID=2971255 RepID=UPI002151BD2F|nr:hypothetical protein [Variovorax sp. ZS18.2.2]MCR6474604.1 hypothetical protein [Variovorax sp. ZS18.2.2]
MPLDLPREVVADGPGALDLAPHARGDFDLLRKGLIQPFGWQTGGNGALKKAAMQRKDIATARDGGIGHCSKTTTRQEKIVPVVDVAVNTIYSCPHSRLKPYLFSNPLQPTAAIFDQEPS